MREDTESSQSYDFRKDFSAIVQPGLVRYLRECGYDPDEPPDGLDDCWLTGQEYAGAVWRMLKSAQNDFCAFGIIRAGSPEIRNWTPESAIALAAEFEADAIAAAADTKPVSLAVQLGADYFIQSEIGIFDHKQRLLLDRLGAIKNARELVHRMLTDGAFNGAIEGAVQRLFFEAIKTAPPKRAVKRLPAALDDVTVGRIADWTDVGGLLAKMRDHVMATAPYPNIPLATAAALMTLSAVSGGRVYTPTGLNLALYVALLAETGDGKDAPLRAPAKFLHAAGLNYMAQPGKTFTVSGFEQCLIDSRGSCVATCDEIGENLLAKILSKRAVANEAAIKHFLMELSGLEDVSPPFALTKRAANGVDRKKLHIIHSVPNASFSLFGASTHARFYEALSQGNVDDGSLNRFLIIDADAPPDEENIVEERVLVPQPIVDALKAISDAGRTSPFEFDENANIWPSLESERAGWGDGALDLYKMLGEQMRAVGRSDTPFKGLYARVKANALKVATLLALSRAVGGLELAVTVEDIEKGAAMALESATTTVDGAMKHMAGSEFEEHCKVLLRRVDEAGEKGITSAMLHRSPGVSKIEPRKFKDASDYLSRTWEVRPHPKRKDSFRYVTLGARDAVEMED